MCFISLQTFRNSRVQDMEFLPYVCERFNPERSPEHDESLSLKITHADLDRRPTCPRGQLVSRRASTGQAPCSVI